MNTISVPHISENRKTLQEWKHFFITLKPKKKPKLQDILKEAGVNTTISEGKKDKLSTNHDIIRF